MIGVNLKQVREYDFISDKPITRLNLTIAVDKLNNYEL